MKHKTVAFAVLFLTLCALAGAFLGITRGDGSLHTAEAKALNTTILIGTEGEDAGAALDAAVKEIARLDALFAADGDGDIARLNAQGSITAESDTIALLSRAKEISAATDGCYSATAAPLLDAWRLALSADRTPGEAELAPLLAKVDDSQINIDGDRITLPEGASVNVDSIGRGYIADRVQKIFADYALDRGFITLGIDKARYADGDAGFLEGSGVACYIDDGGDDAWTVNLPNPADPSRVIATYDSFNDDVFNAGLYQDLVTTGGKTHRLIIDPRTGMLADTGLSSVTVVSDDGPLAAALTEALYVMGRDAALDLWDAHRIDFDAVFINDTGTATPTGRDIYITAGIYQREGTSFHVVDDEGGATPLTDSDSERATRIL